MYPEGEWSHFFEDADSAAPPVAGSGEEIPGPGAEFEIRSLHNLDAEPPAIAVGDTADPDSQSGQLLDDETSDTDTLGSLHSGKFPRKRSDVEAPLYIIERCH